MLDSPHMPQLRDALDFTLDDLAANRAGQLSPRQAAALRRDDRDETRSLFCGLILIVPLAVLGLVLCALLVNLGVLLDWALDYAPLIVGAVVVTGALIAWANHLGVRERRKLPPVQAVAGVMHLVADSSSSREVYALEIDTRRFTISAAVYEGLLAVQRSHDPQTVYRVYYATQGRKPLAAEIVPND